MGKKLIIPGADFSENAVPEISFELVSVGTVYLYWGLSMYINNNNLLWTKEIQELSGAKEYSITPKEGYKVACGVYSGYAVNGSTPVLTDKLNSPSLIKAFSMSKLGESLGSFQMFKGMTNLESVSLGKTIFASITDMFNGCVKLASVKGLYVYAASSLSCARAFLNCTKLKEITIHGDSLIPVSGASQMFAYSNILETIDVATLDFSNATFDSALFSSSQTKLVKVKTNSESYLWLMARLAAAGLLFSIDTSTYTLNKVNITRSGWTAVQGTPDTSTMTLWNGTNTPVSGTSYYVNGCTNYYFTYNQV